MKIHDVKQGELEWWLVRAGIPTASELDNLISPKTMKLREGETPKKYLSRKLAERWQGGPLPSQSDSWAQEQGKILEEEAIPWLEWHHNCEVKRVGFITTNDGKFGSSPDGIIGDDCGLEIKCPFAETHVGYLLGGKVPDDYLMQVHGGMYATGFPRWQFLSYRRHFPPMLITVQRDPKIIDLITAAVETFSNDLANGYDRLMLFNGGPPNSNKSPAV